MLLHIGLLGAGVLAVVTLEPLLPSVNNADMLGKIRHMFPAFKTRFLDLLMN